MKKLFPMVIILLFSLSNCEVAVEKKNTQTPELIEFLRLEKNKTTVIKISDLFFAESYNISLRPCTNIKISHNPSANELKLTPKKNYSGLTFLHFTNDGIAQVLPVIVNQKISVSVKLKPDKPTDNVYVMGSFNTWSRRSIPLSDKDANGIYETTLELDEGVYEYQFVTDYGEFPDPNNSEKVDNGFGSFNSVLKVKSENKKSIPHIYHLPNNAEHRLKFRIASGNNTNQSKIYILEDNFLLDKKHYRIDENVITINTEYLKDHNRIKTFRLVATQNNQRGNIVTVWTQKGNVLKKNEFIWQDAIIYSLMTDRFSNGNAANDRPVHNENLAEQANFQGGDFQGIINQIKSMYFQKIGVNTLWISPINRTTDKAFQEWPQPQRWFTGYHGYWPTAPRETEPRFGSLEKFQELVNIAHKHDIKILLDFVSNHTHSEHPYFQNHRDWYGKLDLPDGRKNIRLFDEFRLTTWFDTFLPSFDFINSPKAMNAVTNDAVWWMKETNIDGFRHDATKHVPLAVWRNITRKIKEEIEPTKKFRCYQIGETFGSAELIKSYVNNGMLDSQFNFELFFTQRRVFAEEDGDMRDLQMALQKTLNIYGYNHLMGNILDSHDQTRMMALLEGDLTLSDDAIEKAWDEEKIQVDKPSTYEKQKALMTFMMTLPGVPIVYYGDEFGMTGAMDPDNRRMMRFGNDLTDEEQAQIRWNSQIIHLRNSHTALRRGDYLPLYCDKNVVIFSRGDQNERLIIAINKSGETQTLSPKLPDWIDIKNPKGLLNKNSSIINNRFHLAPYSGNVWKITD